MENIKENKKKELKFCFVIWVPKEEKKREWRENFGEDHQYDFSELKKAVIP